jgi:uncharacterized membrane protein YccC
MRRYVTQLSVDATQGGLVSALAGLREWVRTHDRGYVALRRAARTTIVMPGLFAFSMRVLNNTEIGAFAAFGSFSLLLLVDFAGPMRNRLRAQASLSVAGAAFVCLGTLVSNHVWLAVTTMTIVGFLTIFAGVVSSVMASATTSLLLAFILSSSLPAPTSLLPDRLAGWGLASGAAFLAVWLLWPAPSRTGLRSNAVNTLRALAERIKADVSWRLSGQRDGAQERDAAATAADASVQTLQHDFLATPWRPTGLSLSARSTVRLVDEILWLNNVIIQDAEIHVTEGVDHFACRVRSASADVLREGAAQLENALEATDQFEHALADLRTALDALEGSATSNEPLGSRLAALHADAPVASTSVTPSECDVAAFVDSLGPGFRALELGYATTQIAANVALTAAADRRRWFDQLSGRQPGDDVGPFITLWRRLSAHMERHSVWLHNSVRGAAGLALAVLVAEETGLQHAFWVVLGTFSVLRSSALNTGQNVMRALAGTLIGFVIGAGLLELIGTNTTVLWLLFPLAVLFAGFAPTAISFAAGQAAFTVTLVILFNLIQPAGWHVGLIRVEDIAIGCGVSLGVGLLFWPRGAASTLGESLHEAYDASAKYLAAAVDFGIGRCDACSDAAAHPHEELSHAARAARRLDDTFRTYIAERGAKPYPVAVVTSTVAGVAILRQCADAIVDLWSRASNEPTGDRSAAKNELTATTRAIAQWYETYGAAMIGQGSVPEPMPEDATAYQRLIDALQHDLREEENESLATAVRIIWTSKHVDSARALQRSLFDSSAIALR